MLVLRPSLLAMSACASALVQGLDSALYCGSDGASDIDVSCESGCGESSCLCEPGSERETDQVAVRVELDAGGTGGNILVEAPIGELPPGSGAVAKRSSHDFAGRCPYPRRLTDLRFAEHAL
jgi:hypothetical protein